MSERADKPTSVVLRLVGSDAAPDVAEVYEILSQCEPHRLGGVEAVLQQRYPSRSWRLARNRGVRKSAVSVKSAAGTQIAVDADVWLKQEIVTSVDSEVMAARLKKGNILFARSEGQVVYAIGTDLVDPLNFVQIRFFVEIEILLPGQVLDAWHLSEYGRSESFPWNEARRSRPTLMSDPNGIVHSLRWLDRCKTSHKIKCQKEMTRLQGTVVQRHLRSGGLGAPVPLLEFEPGLAKHINRPSREERWFGDWISSGAGKLPMGQHSLLETHDHTDKDGTRHVGFIPRALAWPANKISAKCRSPSQLMDRLGAFNCRLQHPFGWYFHMVYGNRVPVVVGRTVAEGISRGQIRLPEWDKAVLMAWIADPYSF